MLTATIVHRKRIVGGVNRQKSVLVKNLILLALWSITASLGVQDLKIAQHVLEMKVVNGVWRKASVIPTLPPARLLLFALYYHVMNTESAQSVLGLRGVSGAPLIPLVLPPSTIPVLSPPMSVMENSVQTTKIVVDVCPHQSVSGVLLSLFAILLSIVLVLTPLMPVMEKGAQTTKIVVDVCLRQNVSGALLSLFAIPPLIVLVLTPPISVMTVQSGVIVVNVLSQKIVCGVLMT